jgi:hypothetical protein
MTTTTGGAPHETGAGDGVGAGQGPRPEGEGAGNGASGPGGGTPPATAPATPPAEDRRLGGWRGRVALALAATVLGAVAAGYTVRAARRGDGQLGQPAPVAGAAAGGGAVGGPAAPAATKGTLRLSGGGQLLFRSTIAGDGYGVLATVPMGAPSGPRTLGDVRCDRIYAAAGTALCLRAGNSALVRYEAVVLDGSLREVRSIPIEGLPSRARISASGHVASWTVFVTGHSYASGSFSTRTSVLDLRTGKMLASNLERFRILKDGEPYESVDVNFWGVTVAADDNRFYATLGTKGETYLVEGDLAARTVRTLRDNVECPSLSPDGTRIAFKKRTRTDPREPWRLHVLDLATLRETPLAETGNVDDQAAWLDNQTIAYALPDPGRPSTHIWAVPADGGGSPRRLVADAFSPTPLP